MQALIVVDVQNDFVTGSLAVPGAAAVLPAINRAIMAFVKAKRLVFYSKCYHVPDHPSFAPQGGPWPPHCVIGTDGAQFADDLYLCPSARVIAKGIEVEALSAFDGTPLARLLRFYQVDSVYVCGLATDYCVRATALDGTAEKFAVSVLTEACAGIYKDEPLEAVMASMHKAGVHLTTYAQHFGQA